MTHGDSMTKESRKILWYVLGVLLAYIMAGYYLTIAINEGKSLILLAVWVFLSIKWSYDLFKLTTRFRGINQN